MYLTRHIEHKLKLLAKSFKVILIVGARQVGKSTLLSHVFPHLKMIVFDPTEDLYNVKKDPDLFLSNFPAPLILDEVQYVPQLLSPLKRKVDLSTQKGQYFLTGSQNISVLKTVAESMAGRVGILHLGGLSPYEMAQSVDSEPTWLERYLTSPETFSTSFKKTLPTPLGLFNTLWRGTFPALAQNNNEIIPAYFSSYMQTYIQRDIRLLENIKDLSDFDRFIGIVAALSAQEINYSEIGREIGIASLTAHRWLDLLTYTYQWNEHHAYSGNAIKRLSRKPKGYITDTGLACYLQRISSPESLARSPLLGALFETFCSNIIHALSDALALPPYFYHWRTNGGAEVDIVLERDGCLYPIEIKCKSTVGKNDARGILAFHETYKDRRIAPGLVIYAGNECYKIDEHAIAFPWNGR